MNKEKVLKDFGIKSREIEPNVYEVLNKEKIVNIDLLQWKLKECILITSDKKGRRKMKNGIYTSKANVYYVIMDYNDKQLGYKYDDIATEKYREVLYMPYKFNPNEIADIDTIYGMDEL